MGIAIATVAAKSHKWTWIFIIITNHNIFQIIKALSMCPWRRPTLPRVNACVQYVCGAWCSLQPYAFTDVAYRHEKCCINPSHCYYYILIIFPKLNMTFAVTMTHHQSSELHTWLSDQTKSTVTSLQKSIVNFPSRFCAMYLSIT